AQPGRCVGQPGVSHRRPRPDGRRTAIVRGSLPPSAVAAVTNRRGDGAASGFSRSRARARRPRAVCGRTAEAGQRWHENGPDEDAITDRIRKAADRYLILPTEMPKALNLVTTQELDILHYPDIGMAPFTYTLAHTRLAPVQTTTWGHPVTSGLPTIDYFISCEPAEPKGADEHYTERLIQLSRLNVCLARPERTAQPRTGSD